MGQAPLPYELLSLLGQFSVQNLAGCNAHECLVALVLHVDVWRGMRI
jgi:hypothetical protein